MSDFDEKDIVQELPTGSDFDPADIHSEETTSEPKAISKMDSFIEGGRQGMTAGFSDEGGGVVGAGLDATQQLLNKLGLTGPSPSQVNSQLAEQGVTGDVGPQSLLDSYRQFRDEDRATMEAAQATNPGSFMGGALAGGIASAPLIPNSVMAPLGHAAQGASLGARALQGAGNAARMGAIGGLGMSNADLTKGDISEAIEDTASGMGAGVALGGAIPVAGQALKTAGPAIAGGLAGSVVSPVGAAIGAAAGAAGKILPEEILQAYQKGKQGVKIGGQEFYDDVSGRLKGLVEKVSSPISKKITKQQAQNAAEITSLDGQLSQIQDDAARSLELSNLKQQAQNAEQVTALNRETVDTAQKLQQQIYDVKNTLGKQFDSIDKDAAATGIFPENREIIGNLIDGITNQSTLQPGQIEAISKRLQPFLGEKGPDAYRSLKQQLVTLTGHADPAVRKAAKQAFGELKNNYTNDLVQGGYGAIADRLGQTNKRWSAALDLEDKFASGLKPDRITGKVEATPDTIRAIGNFADKTPVQMAESDMFSKLLTQLDPQGAKPALSQVDDLAARTLEAKAAKPLELPQGVNPELERLQTLLAQAKKQTPGQIPGLDLNAADPQGLQNQLSQLLPKAGMNTGQDVAENQLKQTFNLLGKEVGPEAAQSLEQEAKTLAKDVRMRNLVNGNKDVDLPVTKLGMAEKVLGGTMRGANKVGEVVGKGERLLKRGISTLSEANPEQLNVLAQRLSSKGPEGVQYAKTLAEAAGKNRQGRNAVIFGLMQQPKFRDLFEQSNEQE